MALGFYEKIEFVEKAKRQLSYFDTVVLKIDGKVWENKIYRHELFQYTQYAPYNTLHVALKDVVYELKFNKLGIEIINIPIALRINLEDGLQPTPSREDFIYTTETIEMLKKKITEVAELFVTKFNTNKVKYPTFKAAYDFIDMRQKMVDFPGRSFVINDIVSFSNVPLQNIEVEGFDSKHLIHHKNRLAHLTYAWTGLARLIRGTISKGHGNFASMYSMNPSRTYISVDRIPTGNLREYLKETFKNEGKIIEFIKPIGKRKLWELRMGLPRNTSENQVLDYHWVLELNRFPRSEWRSLIQESQLIQKEFEGEIKDYTDFKIPKEWLDARKKGLIKSGKYSALNKQEGDMTVYYPRKAANSSGDITFDKKKEKIQDVRKTKSLFIYFTVKDKEKAAQLFKMGKNVVLLNESEIKYIKDLQVLKNYEQFMETTAFKRLATARRGAKVLESFRGIRDYKDIVEACKYCSDKFYKMFTELEAFLRKENMMETKEDVLGSDLGSDIDSIAEKLNLYDNRIIKDIIMLEENLKTFEFMKYLNLPKCPSWWTAAEKTERYKPFKTIINQMLLFKKLKYDELGEFDIIVKRKNNDEIPNDFVPLVASEDTKAEEQDPFLTAEDEDEIVQQDAELLELNLV